MRKLQLEDLSRDLGFSKTLISMVLNGKGNHYGISKKTQATVLDAIAKLKYAPNKFAKSLRTGKSFFIGLIVTDISNPFYSTIAKSIEHVLFRKGYNLMVCSTEESEEREKLLVDMMINQQGVDGLIIASTFNDPEFYSQPHLAGTPIVFIDRVIPDLEANYVVINNQGGAFEAVNALIRKKKKKIACFAITPRHLSTIQDRVNGYRSALEKHKLVFDEQLIRDVDHENIQEGIERGLRELTRRKKSVDAFFVLNNNLAVALLQAVGKKEFSHFSGLEIACFDDVEVFNIVEKKITSVSQPIEAIGKNSSALLLDIIDGKRTGKSNVLLPTKLVER